MISYRCCDEYLNHWCIWALYVRMFTFQGNTKWIDGTPYVITFWEWSWPDMISIERDILRTLLKRAAGIDDPRKEGDCTGAIVSAHFWNVMYWVKVPCDYSVFPALYKTCEYIDNSDDAGLLKGRDVLAGHLNPYYIENYYNNWYARENEMQLPPWSYYATDGDMFYLEVNDDYCPKPWLFITLMFKHECVLIVRNNQAMNVEYTTGRYFIGRKNVTIGHPMAFDTLRHALFFTNLAILLNVSSFYIDGEQCGYYTSPWFDDKQWYFHYDTNCMMSSSFENKMIMKTPDNGLSDCFPGHFECEDKVCILMEYKCDGITQCEDESDEVECGPVCNLPDNECLRCNRTTCKCTDLFYQCETGGCIPISKLCNQVLDCRDGSDENMCAFDNDPGGDTNDLKLDNNGDRHAIYTSRTTTWDQVGEQKLTFSMCVNDGECDPDNSSCNHLRYCHVHECPGYFKCFMSYCIPYQLMCNGRKDCPSGEDEAACGKFLCRGMFECIGDDICVSMQNVCDGIVHCPKSREDEMLCDTIDPPSPKCDIRGNALLCKEARLNMIPLFPTARALLIFNDDLTITGLEFHNMIFLVVVKLVRCSISSLPKEIFADLKRLYELDLGWNMLQMISEDGLNGLHSLRKLNLAYNNIRTLHRNTLASLVNLQELHLEGNQIDFVDPQAFTNLVHLNYIKTNARIVCCFNPVDATCIAIDTGASFGDVFDCNRLLASPYTRAVIWSFAFSTFCLNIASFYANARLWLRTKRKHYVTYMYLNISDWSMALYLLMMGIVDSMYQTEYAAIDSWWRHSWQCKFTGFLALLSMEASNVAILCVTITRFIVVRLPFTYKEYKWAIHRSSMIFMVMSVAFSVGKSFIMDTTSPMCLFFITDPSAPFYIIGIIYVSVVMNALVFLAVIIFSTWMMCAIRESSQMSGRSWKITDQRLVKRMIILSVTNFISWFMICLITLLNTGGHHVSREAIMGSMLVIPANAVLNPLVYCLSSAEIRRALLCHKNASLGHKAT